MVANSRTILLRARHQGGCIPADDYDLGGELSESSKLVQYVSPQAAITYRSRCSTTSCTKRACPPSSRCQRSLARQGMSARAEDNPRVRLGHGKRGRGRPPFLADPAERTAPRDAWPHLPPREGRSRGRPTESTVQRRTCSASHREAVHHSERSLGFGCSHRRTH